MKFILSATLLSLILAFTSLAAAEDTRVFEMRTYYANEGKLEALHARFRDQTVKLFKKHGIENIGYWVPADNKDNTLVYVLAYPSRDARSASWKAFMNDSEWKAAYAASVKDGRLVNKVVSKFMVPTDYSPSIKPTKVASARHFELRVYHTNDGKLANLDSRFRDHTMEIFKNQGMENFAYWHLMEDQDDADSTLVYILGYKNKDARGAAWKGFGGDPRWQKAYKASIADGRLVKKVDSTEMTPTDYSPTR